VLAAIVAIAPGGEFSFAGQDALRSAATTRGRAGGAAPKSLLPVACRGLSRNRTYAFAVPVGGVAAPDLASADGAPAGDVVMIHSDDEMVVAPAFSYEGRLNVTECAAGPSDFLAVRYATQDISPELPVEVRGIELGLDNRHGRTTWPSIALHREDRANPLQPSTTVDGVVVDFADPVALPAPAGDAPDAFGRFLASFAAGVTVDRELDLDDGAYSDAFDRSDQTLDNASSDWLECDLMSLTCAGALRFNVVGQVAEKSVGGDGFVAKFPAAAVHDVRPVEDVNIALRVAYDVTDAMAQRAGVFLRGMSLTEFYVVEYLKATDEIQLGAMTTSGFQTIATVAAGTGPTGTLEVRVWGSHPETHIEVAVNGGAPVISEDDATYTFSGVFRGLLSLGASTGERWDDFEVLRDRDLFAVVQLPPGEDAALPAELSSGTIAWRNVMQSNDGTSFTPLATAPGCGTVGSPRPPNTFVGLEVADTTTDSIDNVFQVESKLVSLELDCPGCPIRQNECSANTGGVDATAPLIEVGQDVDISFTWWNEHAPEIDAILWRVAVWDVPCGLISQVPGPVFMQDVTPVVAAGQDVQPATLMTITPPVRWAGGASTASGHCVQVIEFYDTNLPTKDGCPDGWEGTPCPAACSCIADPDQNIATGVIQLDFDVADPCLPVGVSGLDANTLMLARDAIDPSLTLLEWQSLGPVRSYNLHATGSKPALADATIRDDVPVWRRVDVALSVTDELRPECRLPSMVRVFEADGCPSARSLADP